MTANVSFYLIAILALHENCHFLQERNVPGNVLIVDRHVGKKFLYIYSLGQLERLSMQNRTKTKLKFNLLG